MPWQKKATAPATFNSQEAMVAAITGNASLTWLAQWMPIAPDLTMDTATFCANHVPTPAPALSAVDFIANIATSGLTQELSPALLIPKLLSVAWDQAFSAYCENVGAPYVPDYGNIAGYGVKQSSILRACGSGTSAQIGAIPGTEYAIYYHNVGNFSGWGASSPSVSLQIEYSADGVSWNPWQGNQYGVAGGGGYIMGPGQFAMPGGYTYLRVRASVYDNVADRCSDVTLDFWEYGYHAGPTVTAWTPTPQPEPAGVIRPTVGTYNTIQDLGDELDHQELKLETLLELVNQLVFKAYVPGPPVVSPPVTATPGTPVPLVGTLGAVVTLSNVPDYLGALVGAPERRYGLGRITFGTDTAWFDPITLKVNPQVFAPLPPGTTQAVVHTDPPITSTIASITIPART